MSVRALIRMFGNALGCMSMLVIAGCGGNGGVFHLPPGLTVTEITSTSTPTYSQALTVHVKGTDLDQGLRLDAPDCSDFSENEGGTAFERSFTCVVKLVGTLRFAAIDKTGATLLSGRQLVPSPQVSILTNLGGFVLELDPKAAPVTVDNFLKYTSTGFYSNLIFHRVIADFVVQTGGYKSGLNAVVPTFAPIALESKNKLNNVVASVAMARTSDPASASSQFFINLVDSPTLNFQSAANPGYAVFGSVVSGFDVVKLISAVPTGIVNGILDVPVSEVVILSAVQTQ